MFYSTIILWTSSFNATLKKLRIILERNPIFGDSTLEIVKVQTHAKYLMLFSESFLGEFPDRIAMQLSKHISLPLISFKGDDDCISFSLYLNGDVVTHYHYESNTVRSAIGLEKMFNVLFPPKVKNRESTQVIESYEAQSQKLFWSEHIDSNPPKLLKEQLNSILGIYSEKPIDFDYNYVEDKELSWHGAVVYQWRVRPIPNEKATYNEVFRGLIDAAKPSKKAELIGRYDDCFESRHFDFLDSRIVFPCINQQIPRKLGDSEDFYKPDSEGRLIICREDDNEAKYEIVRPDYNFLIHITNEYFMAASDHGLNLFGTDGDKNMYFWKRNKVYITDISCERSIVETLTGTFSGWYLNSVGEVCVETLSTYQGVISSTRLYKIPRPVF